MKVSLLGYPNSGKTSIFNLLTKQNKKVANFSGVTVDSAEGSFNIDNTSYKIIDLPGINSLSSFSDSKDEIVVSKYIQDNPDDIYLNIVDITHLNRNLLLTLSAITKKMKLILVVNMIDMVKLPEDQINSIQKNLAEILKVPVVMFSAKKKAGVDNLKKAIKNYQYQETTLETSTTENIKIIKAITQKLPKLVSKSTKATEFLDKIFLNKIISIPLFLVVIYTILLITLNIHILFSGFIDTLGAIIFVDFPNKYLASYLPEIILIIIADGIGGGIQTMLTFIPIIFSLFFLLGILEQSGYMARQAFIADGIMQKLGLPGKAFIALTMGLGCTAACSSGCRTLERESDRRLSLMISPTVSCSAKLPVYVYLCFIAFGSMALNIVFLLYFLGIAFAVINGIFLSKSLFNRGKTLPFIMDLPDYMMPNFLYIFKNSLRRVKNFILGLGKIIIPMVAVLTFLSSVSFKGEIVPIDSNKSMLAQVSSVITPALNPMGIDDDNWQATLSIITGFLAKEMVVATIDAVYFPAVNTTANTEEEISITEEISTAINDFKDQVVSRNYLDIFDIASSYSLLNNIDSKYKIMMDKFNGYAGLFAFLLFVLIYSPCLSAMRAIAIEIGAKWAWIVGIWSTFNAYMIATWFYQFATGFSRGLVFSIIFIIVYTGIFFIFKHIGKKNANIWDSNFVFSKKIPD
ncbi:MAG: ferrous iron transporter B [Alphaproteobacteria bacterium]|jgi:ferrous iron transport protein B|nr:ferrous iron transporter B [Alphaproteobacteria bacterium]